MSSLFQWVSGWFHTLRRRAPRAVASVPERARASRPVQVERSVSVARVYALCGSCGAHLAASATLCDDCARRRPLRRV